MPEGTSPVSAKDKFAFTPTVTAVSPNTGCTPAVRPDSHRHGVRRRSHPDDGQIRISSGGLGQLHLDEGMQCSFADSRWRHSRGASDGDGSSDVAGDRPVAEKSARLRPARLGGRSPVYEVISTMKPMQLLPRRCRDPPDRTRALPDAGANLPICTSKPMRSSGLEPPRENSPQGPQPCTQPSDTSAGVQIVRSVRNPGCIGHIGRSDCCHSAATRSAPEQAGRDPSLASWIAHTRSHTRVRFPPSPHLPVESPICASAGQGQLG